jgi:hypothetical protein
MIIRQRDVEVAYRQQQRRYQARHHHILAHAAVLAALKRPPHVSEFGGRLWQPAGRVEGQGRGDVGAVRLEAEEVGEELGNGRKD